MFVKYTPNPWKMSLIYSLLVNSFLEKVQPAEIYIPWVVRTSAKFKICHKNFVIDIAWANYPTLLKINSFTYIFEVFCQIFVVRFKRPIIFQNSSKWVLLTTLNAEISRGKMSPKFSKQLRDFYQEKSLTLNAAKELIK